MKTRRFKILSLTVLLVVPLMLIGTNYVYGEVNPPLGEYHLKGPAVIGLVIITDELDVSTCEDNAGTSTCVKVQFINGNCKGQEILLQETWFGGTLDDLQVGNDLEDMVIDGFGYAACENAPSNSLIINTALQFTKTAESITAKIIMLYLVGF